MIAEDLSDAANYHQFLALAGEWDENRMIPTITSIISLE